jgi:glycerol-3-phosphate dehydrogenase
VAPSRTAALPLVGAEGFAGRWEVRHELAAAAGLDPARVEHLLNRQGALVDDLLALIAERPDLGAVLAGAAEYLRAEIVYAAAAEGARHLDDVLTRRTRISIEAPDRGVSVAAETAGLMGGVLGWSPDQVEREVAHYQARVAAERESQRMPDDETADAARLGAPEIVPLR